jgi:hypothetical protein
MNGRKVILFWLGMPALLLSGVAGAYLDPGSQGIAASRLLLFIGIAVGCVWNRVIPLDQRMQQPRRGKIAGIIVRGCAVVSIGNAIFGDHQALSKFTSTSAAFIGLAAALAYSVLEHREVPPSLL